MIRVKTTVIICAMAIVAATALARVHPFGDAGLYAREHAAKPIMENSAVPTDVRGILTTKCADCHTMSTQPPLYGRIAPVSWLLERDIVLGRRAMNLDSWDQYSPEQQQTVAAKIVQETRDHKMPLLQYRMIHWNARITDADVAALAKWAHSSSGPVQLSNLPSAHGDPSRGKMLFEKRCTGCHELAQNHEGPRLEGVFNRDSGSVGDYTYSAALKKANIIWDNDSLNKWLADPDSLVPGNNMDFLTANPLDRQDIVAFLRQSSGK